MSPLDGKCPLCGEPLPGDSGTGETVPVAGEDHTRRAGCPWEERGRIGTFAAFGETLQRSLFSPSAFFGGLPTVGRVGAAFIYAFIVGTLSAAVAMMWQKAMGGRIPLGGSEMVIPHLPGHLWYAGLAALPLIIFLSTILRSAVLHVSLILLGGASESYAATLKTVCYASSANVFNVFPLLGTPLAWIWRVVLIVIGLREVHRISTGKALLAWLLPFLVVTSVAGAALFGLLLTLVKYFPALGDLVAV
jgi:hypothetical protein